MQPTQPQAQQPTSKPQAPPPPTPKPWWRHINEDWWSVIVGLALVALVSAGIITSVPW